MKKYLSFVLIFMSYGSALAGGEKVKVTVKRDRVVAGELLSVREDALLIALKRYSEYTIEPENQKRIAVIRFTNIKLIQVPGTSYASGGMAIGFLGGLAVTGMILTARESERSTHGLAAIGDGSGSVMILLGGAAIGAFVGGSIGYASSTDDIIMVPDSLTDFSVLKKHARYEDGEPKDLQSVQYYSTFD